MKILHLIDPGWPGGGGCSLRMLAELIARLGGAHHDVLTLGSAAHVNVARRCGVEPIGSASAGGRGRAAAAVICAYERAHGRYDLIHAWTQRAGALAFAAAPRHRRIVSVVREPEHPRIASVLQISRARIIAPFESTRREWIAGGFDTGSIGVIPPAVIDDAIDQEAKVALGDDESAADGERPFIIGMLHEPVDELDANIAMTIAARLALSGVNVRVVVHPDAYRRAEAEMVSHRLGFSHELLIVEDDATEPWRIVSALDAAVRVGGRRLGGDFTPLLWAMAAGVPVIAEDSGAAREVIEDGVSGQLVPDRDVNAVCARLARIHEDRENALKVGAAGATRARERFGISAFCERIGREYGISQA